MMASARSRPGTLLRAALAGVTLAGACAVPAQDYPTRPVRIIVPLSPGGGVDALARIVAQQLNAAWGQPFVVENRSGAGGSIGIELATKATPDGYTLLMSSSSVVTNAATRPTGTSGYDPVRDLQPVSRLTSSAYLLVVTGSLAVTSLQQLLALAKTRPSGVRYASAGVGSITHMGAELLRTMANVPMTHVPFRGVADAYPAVAAGQIDWILGNAISVMALVNAGRLRPIANTGPSRMKQFPDVPTVAESGVPGYDVVGWYGLFAPANVPPALLAKLQAELKRAMQSPDVMKRMEHEAADVIANTPAEFTREVRAEYDRWRALAQRTTRQ